MKKIIKRIGIFIFILLVIAGGVVFIFRDQIKAHLIPEVTQIGDIAIRVKNDTAYVNLKLTIKNKSFIKIESDSIKYNVSLFNKTYLQSEKYIGVVLPPYGKDTVDFSLKIPYIAIIKELKAQRKKGDSASYAINILLQYATVFNKSEISVNKSAKLKIPQPPEIEIVEIKYKKIRLKSIIAEAKIKIINYSPVNLSIKHIQYFINVSKQGNLTGHYTQPIVIKPHETTVFFLPIEMHPKNLVKTIFNILRNKDNYDYVLTLNATLESYDPLKQSFHIDLVKNGEMELKK